MKGGRTRKKGGAAGGDELPSFALPVISDVLSFPPPKKKVLIGVHPILASGHRVNKTLIGDITTKDWIHARTVRPASACVTLT